nr:AP-4 complex subunit mu [Tanacetum cinerariifolium]
MISQFFVLSQRGDNIVFRDYRGDVQKGSAEIFFRKVKFWTEDGETEAPPVFNVDGVNYFHVKVVGLLFVATTRANVSPSLVFELLQRIARVTKDYLGILNEDSIRKNFVLMYELLDEVIDFGYVQTTSTEVLKSCVFNEPIMIDATHMPPLGPAALFMQGNKRMPGTAVTKSVVANEPGGRKREEIFVDIIEKISVTFSSSEMTTNFGKLDKFEGHDFRRWQKKMHFLLTTLKVVYLLTTPMPELLKDATVEAIRIRAKNFVGFWNRVLIHCGSPCLKDEACCSMMTMVDAIAWWIDSGATTHVRKDLCWFKTYEPVEDESVLYTCIEEDPRTYDEAMQSRDAAFWKEAIDDGIRSIMKNNTWVLYDLPPGCKPLGFRQKKGIDYFDTYAPVARITTIRLLLALIAIHNLVIHQMDVKTAFLNGDLDEEVYMKQLEGFVMPGNEHKVCKLVKSLYGLKQAHKQWHQKFDEDMAIRVKAWMSNRIRGFGHVGEGQRHTGRSGKGLRYCSCKLGCTGDRMGDGRFWREGLLRGTV